MVLVFWYWARWVGLKMAYTKHISQFEWENTWVTSWSAQYFRQTHCLNSVLFSWLFFWDTTNVQLPLTSNLHVLEKGPHGWIFHETMLKLFPKRALRRYDLFSFGGQKTYSVCIKLNLPYVQKKNISWAAFKTLLIDDYLGFSISGLIRIHGGYCPLARHVFLLSFAPRSSFSLWNDKKAKADQGEGSPNR